MTKVLLQNRILGCALSLLGCLSLSPTSKGEEPPKKPAEALYLQLSQAALDPNRVYQVRGASLNRSSVQITLEDGTIGFTQDVMGRITGAFFEGDGEILLTPPNAVERRSMSLFTGMAILEERFATAYFRFNDDAAAELRPDLRATNNKQEFMDRWNSTVRNLAGGDAMRMLMTFGGMLPAASAISGDHAFADQASGSPDRFLHARLQGTKLGVFDVYFDSTAAEQVQAGQVKTSENGETYYDVWTSFSPHRPTSAHPVNVDRTPLPETEKSESPISVRRYTISTDVLPPKIHAHARLECEVRQSGARTLLFELSRFLQIESVKLGDQAIEFIHNPALEGSQLSRRGNDLVAVILPEPERAGKKINLEFTYEGDVLAEAGNGLLYVGARGTWYPNRGMEMADFDLEFNYPDEWTLLATGKAAQPQQAAPAAGHQASRWISDRPIPLAGFNLGKYREATAQAGKVTVETYATQGVEKDFPTAHLQVVAPLPGDPSTMRPPQVVVPTTPSPAGNAVKVGESAAQAIQFFADRFGPFPYSHLALTQMPGRDSQGWPGLIFLSSYAFLTDPEREELHFQPYRVLIQRSIPAHETAHQWWGDLIGWSSYRDQWFSEGLASYSALMMLEEKNPAGFNQVMEKYRSDLLEKNKDGISAEDAGPVTLGTRLLSSRLPEGYEAISYGRGTWLFHMLRGMLNDASRSDMGHPTANVDGANEPFIRALRRLRQRYEGKTISTQELVNVFAEDLPPALRFEGKNSLDWFLDSWINGTALPRLELKNVKFAPKATGSIVTGTILQLDSPSDLITSVPVYAIAGSRQPIFLGRVFADGEESSFKISAPAGAHKIVLDPNNTVLKRLK